MARGAGFVDGDRLRVYRRLRGLSARELAEQVGTSKAAIYCYENGTRQPNVERVTELAAALDTEVGAFLSAAADGHVRDLRLQAGLTATQVAHGIGMSRSTYRRIEQEALLPTRGGGTMPYRLAAYFGVTPANIFGRLECHPASRQRHHDATSLLAQLTRRATPQDTPTVFPLVLPDDPTLGELATLLRQPASLVARLVNQELGNLHSLHKQFALARVEHKFIPPAGAAGYPADRIETLVRITRLTEDIDRFNEEAARRMINLLQQSLTYRQWRIMVQLARHAAGSTDPEPLPQAYEPDGNNWTSLLMYRYNDDRLLQQSTSTDDAFVITSTGLRYYNQHLGLYASLYPRLYAPPISPRTPRHRR